MIQKSNYVAPETEMMQLSVDSRILETSVGTTSTETLIAIGGSWDD